MGSCSTRYPILLLHGMNFGDRLPLHRYWGRIPEELRQRGAVIYTSTHDGNATIQENALNLVPLIRRILRETGAEKVNIIAHSKGGLEARYLISTLGEAKHIASVTTLGTPHNGSPTVDALLEKYPEQIKKGSRIFDKLRRIAGDRHPQTLEVIRQLTTDYMKKFNILNQDVHGVFCQSYAFLMSHWYNDVFLSLPYRIVDRYEGRNDGLVSPKSARWKNFRGTLKGLSHAKAIDFLHTENMAGAESDSRFMALAQIYIQIIEDLKVRGL